MESLIEFVSNNYIWFIVAGGVCLLIALILLFAKKGPVKEEVVTNDVPAKNDSQFEEVEIKEEPVKNEQVEETPSFVMPDVVPAKDEFTEPEKKEELSIDSVMNAPVEPDVEDTTETLDIIEDEPEETTVSTEPTEFNFDMPISENNEQVNEVSTPGEVNIQSSNVNVDNANNTDEDIWKF